MQMICTILLACNSIGQPLTVDIALKESGFVLNAAAESQIVSLSSPPRQDAPQKSFSIKENDHWVVWDERGLTVRTGKKVKSSRFPDVVTSPKLFSQDKISSHLKNISSGEYSKVASALTGFELVGDSLYLLLCWRNKKEESWLEALFQLNLKDKAPWPKLLCNIGGTTISSGFVSDQLFVSGQKLGAIVKDGKRWGQFTWDLKDCYGTMQFIGGQLHSASLTDDNQSVLFVERTAYGTNIAGQAALQTPVRRIWAESRYPMSFVSESLPIIRIDEPKRFRFMHATSGLEQEFSLESACSPTKFGLLVWSPKTSPTRAALFPPDSWNAIGRWTKTPQAPEKPVAQPSGSRTRQAQREVQKDRPRR